MLIIYWWARQYPVGDCYEEAEVDKHTAIDVYQWLREVCTTRLVQDPPIVLGGAGLTVQIDESLFRHKPKVNGVSFSCVTVSCHFHFVPHVSHEVERSFPLSCSIIVEDQLQMKCGFLA